MDVLDLILARTEALLVGYVVAYRCGWAAISDRTAE